MDKKSVLLTASGYIIWGVLPLYWGLLSHTDSMLTMDMRIIWSAVFSTAILVGYKETLTADSCVLVSCGVI